MDVVYYIIIPIITSILGGLIGGLFTFIGVKLTIKNNTELKNLDLMERNKEINKTIIQNRPEFKVVENPQHIKEELEIYALPYISPKLQTKEEIVFGYDILDLNEDFWAYYESTICNNGKRAIDLGFLQLKYKSYTNIYSKYEIENWKKAPWAKNYYSDKITLPRWIYPNECIKLKVFYPKASKQCPNLSFDCYMSDEDDNNWFQDNVNLMVDGNKSIPVSNDEFILYYKDDCNKWFIYDQMYHSRQIEKCFIAQDFEKTLQERKEKLWKREHENEKFRYQIKNGADTLKS